MPLNRSLNARFIQVAASAAHTNNNATTGVEVVPGIATLHLNLTASSSPTTLSVAIQSSDDNTNWYTVGTFGTLGAVSSGDKYATVPVSRYIRLAPTISGTSYTFSVVGNTYVTRGA